MVNPNPSPLETTKVSVPLQIYRSLLIFIFLISIYSLTYSGTFRVDDEHILTARAQSYAFRGHLDYPQIYGNDRVRHLSEVLEESASPIVAIEPGQALLGSLTFRFASVADLDGIQAFFTINLCATAITGVLVFLIVRGLGFRPTTGIITSLLFGVGSMAWPFSKTAFRDPLAMMFVALGFFGWVLMSKAEKSRILGAGFFVVGLGCGILVKSTVLMVVPAFLVSSLVITLRKSKRLNARLPLVTIMALIFTLLILLLAVILPGKGPFSRLSLFNYTSLLRRYWEGLNWQTLLAFFGPLVSPAKSIFLFNPILIFIPFALRRSWSKVKDFAIPALLTTILMIIAQALHLGELWAGTLQWGLRFLLPTLPALVVLTAPLLDELLVTKWNMKKYLACLIIGGSFVVQIAGAIVAWGIPYTEWQQGGLNPYVAKALWEFRFNVIPLHLRSVLDLETWDVTWFRSLPHDPRVFILLTLNVIGISMSILGLVRIPTIVQRKKVFVGVISVLTLCILISPIFPSLAFYKNDPVIGGQQSELIRLVSWAEEHVKQGDLVVVDSYGTALWRKMMGEWSKPFPWYSLPFEIPGTEGVGWRIGGTPSMATLELLSGLGINFTRLIYLTSDDTPDFSLMREQQWFAEKLTKIDSVNFQGEIITQGYIYLP